MSYFYRNFVLILFACAALCAQTTKPAERFPKYRLQPADVIEVQFRFTPEYNSTVTVQPDGYITLPIAGSLHVAGTTLDEASAAVREKAVAQLLDPEVSIIVKDFVKPHFIVAGEVVHPGTFDLRGDVTTVQAIATSGGFKDSAKHSRVFLIRRTNEDWAETKILNLKEMMQSGKVTEDVLLRPDDIILVPQNNASKMERYIRWASVAAYGVGGIRP